MPDVIDSHSRWGTRWRWGKHTQCDVLGAAMLRHVSRKRSTPREHPVIDPEAKGDGSDDWPGK